MSREKPDVFPSQLGLQTGVERLFSALSLPELIRQEPLADPYMLPFETYRSRSRAWVAAVYEKSKRKPFSTGFQYLLNSFIELSLFKQFK